MTFYRLNKGRCPIWPGADRPAGIAAKESPQRREWDWKALGAGALRMQATSLATCHPAAAALDRRGTTASFRRIGWNGHMILAVTAEPQT
jgi:hypothetical protein